MNVISDSFGGKYDQIKVGDRIGIVTGPGEFPQEGLCRTGRVYGKQGDRWGRYLRVKMDDFTFRTVHSLTEKGIGAYLLPEPSPEITGKYRCRSCGNRERFVGVDARGYPGDECECGGEECECRVTLRQRFTVVAAGDVLYESFEGGGTGAEIGAYTTILCDECEAVIWTEEARRAA